MAQPLMDAPQTGTVERAGLTTAPTVDRSSVAASPARFDHPVGGRVEAAARRADRSFHGSVRAPASVALLGYVAGALMLLAIGEILVHGHFVAAVRSWDDGLARWMADRRTPAFDGLSGFFSRLANTEGIIVVALLIEAILALRRRWRDLLLVVTGLAVELAVFLTVNEWVQRPRPSVDKLGAEPGTFSFPSGHIAATIVLYGSIALLLALARSRRWRMAAWVAWTATLVLALSVGTSRVYRGMHHPSDVAFGALLGVMSLAIAAIATRASGLGAGPSPTGPTVADHEVGP